MQQIEESKHDSPLDMLATFDALSRQLVIQAYRQELWTAFSKARAQEMELKKKAEQSQ